jgi:FixJ family two-component response regulator
MNTHEKEYVIGKLSAAIDTMEDFLGNARRNVKEAAEATSIATLEDRSRQVLHNLVFGHANACTSLDSAMAVLSRARERELIEAKEAKGE